MANRVLKKRRVRRNFLKNARTLPLRPHTYSEPNPSRTAENRARSCSTGFSGYENHPQPKKWIVILTIAKVCPALLPHFTAPSNQTGLKQHRAEGPTPIITTDVQHGVKMTMQHSTVHSVCTGSDNAWLQHTEQSQKSTVSLHYVFLRKTIFIDFKFLICQTIMTYSFFFN